MKHATQSEIKNPRTYAAERMSLCWMTPVVLALLVLSAQAETSPLSASRQTGAVSNSGSHGAGAGGSGTKNGGPRPPGYLGIGFRDISDEQMTALHLKGGRAVLVGMVDHDGPAGRAGLQPNDILVSLNGQTIEGSESLHRMIHDAGVGVSVALRVLRIGQPMTVTAQLAYRGDVERQALERMAAEPPPMEGAPPVVEGFVETYAAQPEPAPGQHSPGFIASMLHTTPFTGLAVETMEPQLAGFFGAPVGTGLLVHTVMANSPAAMAGIHAGDVVVRVDAVTMKTTVDWTRHLHAGKGGPMAVTLLRDKREITVTLTPEFKKHAMVERPRFF